MTDETAALLTKIEALDAAFKAACALLERNINPGYPADPDTGECYYCETGVFTDEDFEADDGYDKLSVTRFHKDDCAWKLAKDFLEKMNLPEKVCNPGGVHHGPPYCEGHGPCQKPAPGPEGA